MKARVRTYEQFKVHLQQIPRSAWKRFAKHFRRLSNSPKVSATKSPLQNVRAVCGTSSRTSSTSKRPSQHGSLKQGLTTRRQRRLFGTIPVWVFECAIAAVVLTIAAESLTYLRPKKTHKIYVQARIQQMPDEPESMRALILRVSKAVPYFEPKPYPPHLTFITAICPLAQMGEVSRYLRSTVAPEVKQSFEQINPTFHIQSIATNFGGNQVTVVATLHTSHHNPFFRDLMQKKHQWQTAYPHVKWWVENTPHLTLGTYKKKLAAVNTESNIRTIFKQALHGREFMRRNLTIEVAAGD